MKYYFIFFSLQIKIENVKWWGQMRKNTFQKEKIYKHGIHKKYHVTAEIKATYINMHKYQKHNDK